MAGGGGGNAVGDVNPWGVELFQTVRQFQPQTPVQESAFDKWLDHTADREAARIDRVHGAEGVIPSPLWIVLILLSIVIVGYVFFFADSAERAVSQGVLMGSVAATLAAMLLLIQFLDSPFKEGVGGIQPVAMERTLRAPSTRHSWPWAGRLTRRATSREGGPREPGWQAGLVELAATILLAVAAVATAWSSYQATRWNGEQAKTASRVNKTRIDAARAADHAMPSRRLTSRPSSNGSTPTPRTRPSWRASTGTRFRDEFKPAFTAWIATNRSSGGLPAVRLQYKLASAAEADRLDARAGACCHGAARSSGRRTTCLPSSSSPGGCSSPRAKQLRPASHGDACRRWVVFLGAAAWVRPRR